MGGYRTIIRFIVRARAPESVHCSGSAAVSRARNARVVSLSICQRPFFMRIPVGKKKKKRNARFVHPEQKDYIVRRAARQ